jgi:hypothetical protein
MIRPNANGFWLILHLNMIRQVKVESDLKSYITKAGGWRDQYKKNIEQRSNNSESRRHDHQK